MPALRLLTVTVIVIDGTGNEAAVEGTDIFDSDGFLQIQRFINAKLIDIVSVMLFRVIDAAIYGSSLPAFSLRNGNGEPFYLHDRISRRRGKRIGQRQGIRRSGTGKKQTQA